MQIGSVFLVITAALYAFNTVKIVLHKENIQPLNFKK